MLECFYVQIPTLSGQTTLQYSSEAGIPVRGRGSSQKGTSGNKKEIKEIFEKDSAESNSKVIHLSFEIKLGTF